MACYVPSLEDYLPASYNGIPFEALALTTIAGRRFVEGEFLFSNNNRIIDLGRRIRRFTVEGRFVGEGHTLLAQALMEMVDRLPSGGILVHPTRGVLRVGISELRIEENAHDDMGVSTFTMECVEARTGGILDIITDWGNIGLKGALDVLSGNFKDSLANINFGGSSLGAAKTGVGVVLSGYKLATISNNNQLIPEVTANLNRSISSNIIAQPEIYANIIENGMDYIVRDATTKNTAIKALRSIIIDVSKRIPGQRETDVANIIISLTKQMALLYWSDSVIDTVSPNNNQAMADYLWWVKEMESEISRAHNICNACAYNTLSETLSHGRSALLSRIARGSQVTEYNIGEGQPALVAAWEIWGDAGRASELPNYNNGMPWMVGNRVIGIN